MFFRRKKTRPSVFSGTPGWPSSTRKTHRRTRSIPRPQSSTSSTSTRKSPSTPTRRHVSEGGLFKKLKKILLLGVLVGILSWGAYFLFLSDQLTVQTIQVVESGNVVSDHPLKDLLVQFQGSNLLLIDTQELEGYLQQKYQSYESIEILKNFPDTLTINIAHYPEVANLKMEDLNGEESLWLLNSHGNLVNGDTSETLPWIKIVATEPVSDGSEIISQERLAFILEAIQNFEDRFGMNVIHALYLADAREVHLWTEREFYVWLDMTGDLDQQLNKLKKSISKLDIYELPLEYIDLRINGINGEKVIYKVNTAS